MSKKNKGEKRPTARGKKEKREEAEDQSRLRQERELRTAVTVSTVVFITIWVMLLIIVWSNGWFGAGK